MADPERTGIGGDGPEAARLAREVRFGRLLGAGAALCLLAAPSRGQVDSSRHPGAVAFIRVIADVRVDFGGMRAPVERKGVELATGSEYRDEDERDAPVIAATQMPPAVTAVLLRLLHKDAGARYRTAAAVADALRRALPRPSMVVEQVKRRRRRRGALLGAALAVAGVVGVAILARGRTGGLGSSTLGCQISLPGQR